jgi:hypothetical protein
MAKGLTFKMRLDENDRARMNMLAEHFSASAATVVRILVKQKADAIEREARAVAAATKKGRT